MYIRRVCFSLNYVEDTDVAAGFAGVDGNHAVLRLQQTAHDIQNSGLTHCLGLFDVVAGEWGV